MLVGLSVLLSYLGEVLLTKRAAAKYEELCHSGASLVAQIVKKKNLPAMQETQVRSLGWKDPLQEGMAPHSSILAWRIPWKEEPGRLQSMGHKESDTTEQ